MGANDSIADLQHELSRLLNSGDAVLDLHGIGLPNVVRAVGRRIKAVVIRDRCVELFEVTPAGNEPFEQPCSRAASGKELLSALQDSGVERLIVIAASEAVLQTWERSLSDVEKGGIETVRLPAADRAAAGDYMPSQDADKVAARLRELGYI